MTRDHSPRLPGTARCAVMGAVLLALFGVPGFSDALFGSGDLGWSTTAWATPSAADDDDDDDDDDGELFELDDDDDSTSDTGSSLVGSSENPDAVPEFGVVREARTDTDKKPLLKYPTQVALRPLTLNEGMFRVAANVPVFPSPASLSSTLHLDFGVTDDIEVGVGYGAGTLNSDGYIVGKSFHVQARYRIFRWLSVEARVPMYADPFAIGLTLGAPMIFRLGQKTAFVLGHEFFHVRIFRFVPSLADAQFNEDRVVQYERNQIIPRGELRFLAGVIYQLKDNLAIGGDSGILANDFGLTDAGVPFRVSLTYSPSNKVDLAGRLGFDNLDNPDTSFNLQLSAVLRI